MIEIAGVFLSAFVRGLLAGMFVGMVAPDLTTWPRLFAVTLFFLLVQVPECGVKEPGR